MFLVLSTDFANTPDSLRDAVLHNDQTPQHPIIRLSSLAILFRYGWSPPNQRPVTQHCHQDRITPGLNFSIDPVFRFYLMALALLVLYPLTVLLFIPFGCTRDACAVSVDGSLISLLSCVLTQQNDYYYFLIDCAAVICAAVVNDSFPRHRVEVQVDMVLLPET